MIYKDIYIRIYKDINEYRNIFKQYIQMSKQNKHLQPRNEVGFVDLTGPATRCRLSRSLRPRRHVMEAYSAVQRACSLCDGAARSWLPDF
jgi:hypothetical protein